MKKMIPALILGAVCSIPFTTQNVKADSLNIDLEDSKQNNLQVEDSENKIDLQENGDSLSNEVLSENNESESSFNLNNEDYDNLSLDSNDIETVSEIDSTDETKENINEDSSVKENSFDSPKEVTYSNYSLRTSSNVNNLEPEFVANNIVDEVKDLKNKANLDVMVNWFIEAKDNGLTYDMGYPQRVSDKAADCSSAVYRAMIEAGFLPKGSGIGNTETLFALGDKKSVMYKINENEIRYGDIFVAGYRGASAGAGGHTGVILDKDLIIHMNYRTDGVAITPRVGYMGDNSFPVSYYRLVNGKTNLNIKEFKENLSEEAAKYEREGRVYRNGEYLPKGYVLEGIDVSNHQDGLDFERNDYQIDFIIAKATESSDYSDPLFDEYYNDAKSHGLKFGAYHFLQATNVDEAIKEADYFLSRVEGKEVDFGYWCDVEAKTFTLPKKEATEVVKAFCDYIKSKGHFVGIYASEYWGFQDHMNYDELKDYDLWVANWGSKTAPSLKNTLIWQYDVTKNIPGFNVPSIHRVDVNYAKKDISQIIRASYNNGTKKTESTSQSKPSIPKGNKNLDTIVDEVLSGKWGVGSQREKNLTRAGYSYTEVQNAVNKRLENKEKPSVKVEDKKEEVKKPTTTEKPNTTKEEASSLEKIAKEVIDGKWSFGENRKTKLEKAGYSYNKVQDKVNELLGIKTTNKTTETVKTEDKKEEKPTTTEKPSTTKEKEASSLEKIAKEVIDGKWSFGESRKTKLEKAGYSYNKVQDKVNELLGIKTTSKSTTSKAQNNSSTSTNKTSKKSNSDIAKEVLNGKWGNGEVRKQKLTNAGYDYNAVQKIVNTLV
ncbi:MAG: GH25 family lysozyme [Peptoniphilaceae bacterium]|nr:GH25 family lysozyme [Peptoniphilaceae bacterium]